MTINPPRTYPDTVSAGTERQCLTGVLAEDVNLAVWQRSLTPRIRQFAHRFATQQGKWERFCVLSSGSSIAETFPENSRQLSGFDDWVADVDEVIDMYQCLFEPEQIGVRLHVLERTMCPRFHVDRVPVRLLCTYSGPGTEWLPNHKAIRPAKPGPLPEQQAQTEDIQRLGTGDVALLKGEAWIGNEGRGLVHRSPAASNEPRLVLALDWL